MRQRPESGNRQLVMTHPDELRGLSISILGHRYAGPLRIEDERVDPERQKAWEAQLNRAYFACGCPQSAAAMTLALLAYVVVAAIAQPFGSIWAYLGWGLAVTIAGAVAGKAVGLYAANRRLQELTDSIRKEWPAPPRVEREPVGCG